MHCIYIVVPHHNPFPLLFSYFQMDGYATISVGHRFWMWPSDLSLGHSPWLTVPLAKKRDVVLRAVQAVTASRRKERKKGKEYAPWNNIRDPQLIRRRPKVIGVFFKSIHVHSRCGDASESQNQFHWIYRVAENVVRVCKTKKTQLLKFQREKTSDIGRG